MNKDSPIYDSKLCVIHDYQYELCENLYAETQIDADHLTEWEYNLIQNCYTLMRTHIAPDWCLTQTQQEKLEEIFIRITGGDD